MKLGILQAATSRFILSVVLFCSLASAARDSRQLASIRDVAIAASAGEELTLVLEREECGLNVPLLSTAVLDMKQYHIGNTEEVGLFVSVTTSFLAGSTVPDNPNVLVVIDVELKDEDGSATVTITDIDLKNGWSVMGTETATCPFNAGVTVFSHTEPDSPPDLLTTFEEINTAFFESGRPIYGYFTLSSCEDTLGTGNFQGTSEVYFRSVFGLTDAISGTLNLLDSHPYVAPGSVSGSFEIRSAVVQAIEDGSVVVILTRRDPASWEVTGVEGYLCTIPESGAIFAGKQGAASAVSREGSSKAATKELVSDFEEIKNNLLSGNDVRIHVNTGECESDDPTSDEFLIAAGPLPWEYIVTRGGNRITFTYDTTGDAFVSPRLTTHMFQAYEAGLVNVSSATYDPVTGERLESTSFLCPLDGSAAGFTVVSSDQEKLTTYSSIVESMTQRGRLFKSIVDMNFCELPQIVEYGAVGSYYPANFLLVDSSGPAEMKYLFSPMTGGEQKSVPEDGAIMRDFPMYAFEPVDVLFSQRLLDFATLEPIKDDFVYVCNLNDGTEGAVSVYV